MMVNILCKGRFLAIEFFPHLSKVQFFLPNKGPIGAFHVVLIRKLSLESLFIFMLNL